jgi:fatty-acyl-CoA synthase
VVVVRPGMQLSDSELIEYMRLHLASFKLPKSVVVVDQLPKTGANKVDKQLLATKHGSA